MWHQKSSRMKLIKMRNSDELRELKTSEKEDSLVKEVLQIGQYLIEWK